MKQKNKVLYRALVVGITFLQLLHVVACTNKDTTKDKTNVNQETSVKPETDLINNLDHPVPDYYEIDEIDIFDRDTECKRNFLGMVMTDDQIITAVHQTDSMALSEEESAFSHEKNRFLLYFFNFSGELMRELDISPFIDGYIETIQAIGITKISTDAEEELLYLIGKPISFSSESELTSERGNLVIYYLDLQGELKKEKVLSASSNQDEKQQEYFYDSAILDKEGNIYTLGFDQKSGGGSFLQVFSPEDKEIFTLENEPNGTKAWQYNRNYYPFLIDNSVFVYVDDISGGYGTRVSSVNLEEKKLNPPVQMDSFGINGQANITAAEAGILQTDLSGIYYYDKNKEEVETVIKWSEQDLSLSDVIEKSLCALRLKDDKIFVSKMTYNGRGDTSDVFFYMLTKSANPNQRKEKLIISGLFLTYNSILQDAIMEFNQQSDTARIEIRDYAVNAEIMTAEINDYFLLLEKSKEAMNMDFITGNMPDIIYGSPESGSLYARKEILSDLNIFIDNDPEFQKSDFYPNILELGEYNGKLLQIYTCFYIKPLIGLETVIDGRTTWTMEEFRNSVSKYKKGVEIFGNITQSHLLESLLYSYNRTLFDEGTKTANFASAEFMDILSLAKDYGLSDREMQVVIPGDYNELPIGEITIASPESYTYFLPFEDDIRMAMIGYPSAEESRIPISTSQSISIVESSANKEAAWEFIKTLLSEKYQKEQVMSDFAGIPLRISVNEEMIEAAMQDDGIHRHLTEEDAEALKEILNRKLTTSFITESLRNIVVEESQAYFSDQKTIEQTVEIIQNRVQTLLNENM